MSSRTPKPMTRVAPGGHGPGEHEMFRLRAPVVIFYIWLAFAVFNVVDLTLQAKPRFALEVSLVVLTITGVAYACGLRPRVISDARGLTVINPIREWHLPWSALRAVDVRDWVRFTCAGRSRPVESWALFATARVKRNSREWAKTYVSRNPAIQRFSDETTQQLMTQPEVVIIANRIEARLRAEEAAAKASQTPPDDDGGVTARWAWLSIAAVAVPALAFVVTVLVG